MPVKEKTTTFERQESPPLFFLILFMIFFFFFARSGQTQCGFLRASTGPPQIVQPSTSTTSADVSLGGTAQISIYIFGFPEPTGFLLQATNNGLDLTKSPRHTLLYTVRVPPFGVLTVTITNLVEADFTVYTVTVDNGVGDALVYTISVNKGGCLCGEPESLKYGEVCTAKISRMWARAIIYYIFR